MLDDLISRQAAIEQIEAIFPVDPHANEWAEGVAIGAALAKQFISTLPSAQPERKTGQWQEDPSGYGFWICSACGFISEASGADLLYNFCPNCGADMRGEKNE